MALPLGHGAKTSKRHQRLVGGLRQCLRALFISALVVSWIAAGASAKISRVFIVPLSHLDIGFTATPQEVSDHFKGSVDLALRLVANLPDARWNIETFWQLEQWLAANAGSPSYELLEKARLTGRLGIGAAYASMHSSLMTGEELLRMLYPAQELGRKIGSPLKTAVMNDVPGFAWYVPQALNASGIKRLILGTNLQFDGGASFSAHNIPFYWVGPDGSSVLTWVSREGYLEGSFYWELHNPERFESRLEAMERAGYPYDAILIIDGYGDNAGVDPMLTRLNAIKRLRSHLNGVEIHYTLCDFAQATRRPLPGCDSFSVTRPRYLARRQRQRDHQPRRCRSPGRRMGRHRRAPGGLCLQRRRYRPLERPFSPPGSDAHRPRRPKGGRRPDKGPRRNGLRHRAGRSRPLALLLFVWDERWRI